MLFFVLLVHLRVVAEIRWPLASYVTSQCSASLLQQTSLLPLFSQPSSRDFSQTTLLLLKKWQTPSSLLLWRFTPEWVQIFSLHLINHITFSTCVICQSWCKVSYKLMLGISESQFSCLDCSVTSRWECSMTGWLIMRIRDISVIFCLRCQASISTRYGLSHIFSKFTNLHSAVSHNMNHF